MAVLETIKNFFTPVIWAEPEVIVVGGGFGGATGELLLAPGRAVVAREGLTPGRDTVRIVEAQLGADAGVIGAAMIAVEALGAEG